MAIPAILLFIFYSYRTDNPMCKDYFFAFTAAASMGKHAL